MNELTNKESNRLQKEIDHILDSGANSIRLLEMFNNFLKNRYSKDDNSRNELLKKLGWTITCESPLEIEHFEGSSATGLAANILIEELINNPEDYV